MSWGQPLITVTVCMGKPEDEEDFDTAYNNAVKLRADEKQRDNSKGDGHPVDESGDAKSSDDADS